jgi:hypothetical protein
MVRGYNKRGAEKTPHRALHGHVLLFTSGLQCTMASALKEWKNSTLLGTPPSLLRVCRYGMFL